MTPPFQKVALIGLGLIAGSMAHAMREQGLAERISGHARSAATRETAAEIGLVDEVTETAAEAVRDADLVVLAVPVGAMAEVAAEIEQRIRDTMGLGEAAEPADEQVPAGIDPVTGEVEF